MAGLFLHAQGAHGLVADPHAAATAQFTALGFTHPHHFAFPGWHGLHVPYILGGPDTLLVDGPDMVAVAGTLAFDGQLGHDALRALLTAFEPPQLDWSRLAGQFAVLIRKRGRSFLFTDWFGAFQLFHDEGGQVFSTSLLAALDVQQRVRFSPQGLYEYAFNVTPVGDDTVFEGLRTLGPDRIVELLPDGIRYHPVTRTLPGIDPARALPDRIASARARLHAVVAPHVAAFDRINSPLSGGLDSRLLLAALREAGARPDLYVYGPPGSEDVAVAQAIGRAEGVPVAWINKADTHIAPDAFADHVAREFHVWDGLPNYGNIFDGGGNTAAAHARHADSALAASGGCGEIFRDFFYLPDRAMTADTVAATFFARFLASDASPRFDPHAFLDRIAAKIAAAIAMPRHARIPRDRIEHIYPAVRCRALFGREISTEARFGAYLMPFLDHGVVADAMTLPLALKRAGRFEAQLIAAIDPGLAAHPSAYGHDFSGPPSTRHRFSEWQSRIRPPWLRRQSYALRRRLAAQGDEHGGLLAPEYMHRVIDPDFPVMRRWFEMDRVADSGLWRRLACLEYLGQWLGSRLAE